MFVLRAFSFKAIGSFKDVLDIYKAFGDPSTDIISSVTNERYGSISCCGNGFSQECSKISNPRVEITADFVELSSIDVLSPCTGISKSFSDEFISIFYETFDKFLGSLSCFLLPLKGV